ncbi:DNA-binding transcriptional regulator, GntR family [Poseidonocella pacifica]|uniref:DNA-binding transcriptional regulator, GntR family n=1 Tax=Poseidonocella pacifica TaxID=871651 RepID=A0A1I0X7J7_9RHOB|nr:GntR family transcriptional regulator [Poseidonocella pacifica]SFA96985.1 DNA-binding transcriptional regulator, GntR family [Poseidonocella pacifica]
MSLQPTQHPISAPLERKALAVELTDMLREIILEGELSPGEKVPEKALTERFGVSRTPLREAMKVLAAEGLIDLVPNRGAFIASQTEEELSDLFPVLASLEGLAGELAAAAASEAQIAEIRRLTQALRTSHEEADRPTYFAINQAIHAAILEASGNECLRRTHALVAYRIQRARYQANLTQRRWTEAVSEHERIAEALVARDAGGLGQLMKAHMLNKLHSIIAG